MNVYISDTHLLHANIIRYCGRPFRSIDHMDQALMGAMREADARGYSLCHMGDFTFRPSEVRSRYGGLDGSSRHILVAGNHERKRRNGEGKALYSFFGKVVGDERTWKTNTWIVDDELDGASIRVLLSHEPQEDLQGCALNLYGHTHNTAARDPDRFAREYPWLVGGKPTHFNVCVEQIGYRPRTLAEIVGMREEGHTLL